MAGALWRPPGSTIADRGMPSRVDKRVAPHREGAADKQRRKTLITICDHKPRGKRGETTSAISQDRISIRILEPALQQKTE